MLAEGRDKGELRFSAEPEQMARTFFTALEGAMLAARAFSDPERLAQATNYWLDHLEPSEASSAGPSS